MAKCKLCKTNIPEGTEYCMDCQDKGKVKANESYLDSLLNSVKNSAPTAESIYKKKNSSTLGSVNRDLNKEAESNSDSEHIKLNDNFKMPNNQEAFDLDELELFHSIDLKDIEDFDELYSSDDLKNFDNDIVISDEELFGEDLSNILSDKVQYEAVTEPSYVNSDKKTDNKANQDPVIDLKTEPVKNQNKAAEEQIYHEAETIIEKPEEEPNGKEETVSHKIMEDVLKQDTPAELDKMAANTPEVYEVIENQDEVIENQDEVPKSSQNISANVINNYQDEDNFDDDLNDLLNSLDIANSNIDNTEKEDELLPNVNSEKPAPNNNKVKDEPVKDESEYEEPENEALDDDFTSLLQQISLDDPVTADVKAINDLLSGEAAAPKNKSNMPSDVGEVFSDALKAVSSLKDFDIDEESILNQIPEIKDKGKKAGKSKKQKKAGNKPKNGNPEQEKEKKSLFQRLFGNIKNKNAQEMQSDSKLTQAQAASPVKEKPKKEAKKGKKPKKAKKGSAPEEIDNALDEKKQGKDKKDNKKDNKKDKTEKKKKTKEIIQVIDEIEEDEGRINRLGATIVFIFFGLLVMLLLVGTKAVSYTLNIQSATNYFDKQKYTQAYNEVYGIEIKDEDIEIYDKIMTVMFVNKQLNSYNNYYSLKEYPQALDSLLKGLSRYNKYIELATMLGIKTDLDYVRQQILAELDNVFNLSEKEALDMIDYDSMEEYSKEVYDVVLEKMN